MTSLFRALRRFAPLFALTTSAAFAAPTVPGPSQIIPLPLNPVVPPALRDCAQRTASGVGYSVLRASQGVKPTDGDYVLTNYIGYLAASGATFDQAMQAPMPVAGVIKGFAEGIKLMPKGSIYRICVPAALGYGAEDKGPIPPNSNLVFQVELLDLRSATEVEAAQKQAGGQRQP
jgi:FKBP-type peptidyl-prolyl cis-trans isomerase FkpA